MGGMSDLVQWLRAQLDKDEREITDPYQATSWHAKSCGSVPDVLYPECETGACDCGVPARVLRGIDADRALLADYASAQETVDAIAHPDMYDVGRAQGLEEAVRRRALSFADRPGYRAEWRP